MQESTSRPPRIPGFIGPVARALLIGLLVMVIAACGRRVDESLLPTPIPTIAPFVTEIPIPPTRIPTTVPTPLPTVAILMPTSTPESTETADDVAEEPTGATAGEALDPTPEETPTEAAGSTDQDEDLLADETPIPAESDATDEAVDETDADVTPTPTEEASEEVTEESAEEAADTDAQESGPDTPADEPTDTTADTTDEDAAADDADADAADEADASTAEDDAAARAEAMEDEVADGNEVTDGDEVAENGPSVDGPLAQFQQPTANAIVPLTFTVRAHVEGVTILPVPADATGTDADPDADADAHAHDEPDAIDAPDAEADSAATPASDEIDSDTTDADEASQSSDESDAAEGEETKADTASSTAADEADTGAEDTDVSDAEIAEPENTEGAATPETEADTDSEPETDSDTETDTDTDTDTDTEAYLFVLVNLPAIEAAAPVPVEDSYVVPVEADGSAELSLNPGTYILRLQLADAGLNALPTNAGAITVIVREGAAPRSVRIAMPTDGAVVPPEFEVVMAATGLTVEPSGAPVAGVERGSSGHFHLLIDTDFIAPDQIIPTSDNHLHFGAGQLTTTVTLEPGEHVIRLQMADGLHVGLRGEEYRDAITVTVAADASSPQVMFVEPVDGATVPTTFPVRWAATGLLVEPIGAVLEPGRGHFHVLIDTDFVPAGEVIPTDDAHRHFGAGQLSSELTLEPGEYTLRLQMANGAHIVLEGAEYQDTITITVSDTAGDIADDDSAVADTTDEDATTEEDQTSEEDETSRD